MAGQYALLALIIVLAAVVAYDIIPIADAPCPPGTAGCQDAYFSESYFHARQSFITAARELGAQLHSLSIFVDPATNIEYTTDIAVVEGTRKDVLLVHLSGVHGPEGFAGSAVQLAALKRLQDGKLAGQPQAPFTTVFVHAVNPYGFANLRRFNEQNVDLNRNNLRPDQWQIALSRPKTFASYDLFDPMLNPTYVPQWYHRFTVLPSAVLMILQHGFQKCKKALVTGQYNKPSGLYFGGRETQPSLAKLHAFFKSHFKGAKVVVSIDVHTGLGPSGMDSIMLSTEEERIRAAPVFTNAHSVESPFSGGGGASAGYEDAIGTETMNNVWGPETKIIAVCQEFGTVPGLLVVRAMILENAGFHYARGSDQHNAAKQLVKGVFYVPTTAWRASVVNRGLAALGDATRYLLELPAVTKATP